VTWDPSKFDLSSYLSCGGIFLGGTSLQNKRSISLLNVYGPCTDRKSFWDNVVDRGMLAHKNLLVAEDFNFTVSAGEVWGDTTHLDQLAGYFIDIFQDNMLVDIIHDELVPTW
jgi:hypothetical protein